MREHTITPDNVLTEVEDNKLHVNGKVHKLFPKLSAEQIISGQKANPKQEESKADAGIAPIDVMPVELRQLVMELSNKYKFPIDYSITCILYCVSLCIGKQYKATVKSKWHETVNLYMAIVAAPGAMKTPVLNFFTKPIKEQDANNYKEYIGKHAQWEASKKAATKDNPFNEPEPVWKQSLVSDFTTEALICVLQNATGGSGVCSDELAGFFNNLNRYSKGSDVQMFLSLYNGQNVTVNRKGSKPVCITDPFLSIMGGIQPGILPAIFTDELMANGMFDRFLFCFPANIKKELAPDEDITPGLYEAYVSMLQRISTSNPGDTSYTGFTIDAKQALNNYRTSKANAVNEANIEGDYKLAGVLNKSDYHVIRFSLIMQVIYNAFNHAPTNVISLKAVEAAKRLTDYYLSHAERVLNAVTGNAVSMMPDDKKKLFEALPDDEEFKTAQAVEIGFSVRTGREGNGYQMGKAVFI